ncbi:MAG: ABC transporter ATP-binding protein [Anaerolineae bacterium]|nr:ABC transporter ATP-binding protein [Anaerolineae bacterium]
MMSGFRLTYLAATLSLGMAALVKVGVFALLAHFVDNVLGQKDTQPATIALIAVAFIGLAAGEGLFSFLSGRLAARTAEGIIFRLRNYLFDHVQRLTFTYHDKAQTGDLIQRSTSDVDTIRRFFADQAIGLGRIFLLFGVNMTALLILNARLALLSVIVIPLIAIMSLFFFRRLSKAYKGFQEQDGVTSTLLQENLSGVRVVKAFARQKYEIEKYEAANVERFRRGAAFMKMHAMYWPITDIICGSQAAFGYFMGATMVIDGHISLGTYIAYVGLVWQVINPLRNLGRIIVHMSEGGVSYNRVMEMIKQEREPLTDGTFEPKGSVRGEIVFDDVSFEYDAEAQVLHNISFRAEPGQAIALLGSTGSGKTTLVNLLPRFYDYTSGRLTLDGVDLKDYSRETLRRQIGIVEQEPFLFSRSIRENITYGVHREVTQDEIEAAARAAAIHDVIQSFPKGYDTLVGEKGVTLSGGQKQRVAIARTLLKDPRILILDDATSSVDTETEASIREALQALMKGRTSFIIAHRIQSVMNADLILVLDKGRIVQRGAHAELLAQPGIYRQIYDVQTRVEIELEKEIARV